MIRRVFVSSQRARAEAPEHPQCYFHPDTEQQGERTGFLMTLYGSVGVKQLARAFMATVQSSRITAVARASQPSNRQPEYATLLKRFLPYTHCRLFFFLFTSCQTCPHSIKTTRVDQCK